MMQISKEVETHIYTFIREDLPISQQAVQAGHALYIAGQSSSPDDHPSFVFLSTKTKEQLQAALEYVRELGIGTFEFHEPYMNWGLTSFATKPITQDQRKLFAKFQLWRK